MRRFIALTLVSIATAAPGLAAPGVTTTSVNFRSGPGTQFSSIRTLPAGTAIDIGECEDSGSWCAVTVQGRSGFVSGRYVQENKEAEGWPRSYETGKGRMTLYQPQFTEWSDFKSIDALVAAQFQKSPDANPVFGVIGLKGKTSYDEDAGEVVITDITVTDLNFSGLGRDDLTALAVETGKLLPAGPVTVSESRVTASLAEQKRMTDVSGLKADPPPIFVSKSPAILLQTDGPAAYAPVKGKTGLSFVVNTNWDLFRIDEGGALYLRDDTHWLKGSAATGPWAAVAELPALLKELPDDNSWADARAAMPPEAYGSAAVPKVIATDKPAELILFEGEPALQDVPGTALQWASNTESDVFFDKTGKQWYVLLSGRWFRATTLDGPWTFATPDLPADFRNIPEDGPYYAVRASVPGTSESAEARLKASIPTTARVEAGSITPTVAYTGDAQFAPIETTDLSYATNTSETVIRVGDRYFLLQDGVWFMADNPNGPWQLAREIPEAIYRIPPSSPLYNVTYVRVYESEPDAVWYGYTMGYLYGFLAWDTYVYGTGWSYPPYWYNWAGYGYPIYYPRPITWGLGAYYNPVRGMYGRYGYAYGPYRGIAGARAWNPRTDTYMPCRRSLGTARFGRLRRSIQSSHRRSGLRGGRTQRLRRMEIGRRQTRLGMGAGDGARERGWRSALRWNTSNGQGFIREGRRGDSMRAGTATSIAIPVMVGSTSMAAGRTRDGRKHGNCSSAARDAKDFHRKDASGCRSVGEARRSGDWLEPERPARRALRSASAWVGAIRSGGTLSTGMRFVIGHRTVRQYSSARPHSRGRPQGNDRRSRSALLRSVRRPASNCRRMSCATPRRVMSAINGRWRAGSSPRHRRSSPVRHRSGHRGAWARAAASAEAVDAAEASGVADAVDAANTWSGT